MSHTKEPWAVLASKKLVLADHLFWHIVPASFANAASQPTRGWGSHEIAEMNAGTTANPSNDCGEANARRIVACVNEFAGITDPTKLKNLLLECLALESSHSVDWEEHKMYVLRAFRDLVGDGFGTEAEQHENAR